MTAPFVSVLIPCLNEEDYLEPCLDAVFAQDYPADRVEVLVAEGGSTDRSRALLERYAAREPRLRWLDNPRRRQAPGLNLLLEHCRGDVIVRLDVHAEYAKDYLSQCVAVLDETGADCVGGAQRARAKTFFQRALATALGSPLGVGGADYRHAEREGFVDTVFCGAFRRSVFEQVGLYDPGAVTNEDAELNQRIVASGGRIYLSRRIQAFYFPRASLTALARQYFRYGFGRARTLLKHRGLPTLRPMLPFFTVTAGLTLLLAAPRSPVTWGAAALYASLSTLEALRVSRHAPAQVPVVACIFPVLHASHGVGFALGLVRYALRADWAEPARLTPRG